MNSVYRGKLTFNLVECGAAASWIDLDLLIDVHGCLGFTLRAPNRDWALGVPGVERGKATIIPFYGALPSPLGHLSAVLGSRLVRAEALALPIFDGIGRAIIDILELVRLGYPYSAVRAIVHLIPRSRLGAIELRRIIRLCKHAWPPRS